MSLVSKKMVSFGALSILLTGKVININIDKINKLAGI
jgi:hypothetical protein